MTKAEKRVVRAAMRRYYAMKDFPHGDYFDRVRTRSVALTKACAALSRKDKR